MAIDTIIDQKPVDLEPAKKKKKEKRKREASENAVDESSLLVESKEERKKRKKEKAERKNAAGSTSSPNEDLDQLTQTHLADEKKDKKSKDKKDKKKLKEVQAGNPEENGVMKKRMRVESSQAESEVQSAQATTLSDEELSMYLSEEGISIDCGSATVPDNLRPIMSFSSLLPRIPQLLHGAVTAFKKPTPIQACTWPAVLEGRDVVGIAETGSGKTLAFGIPALSNISKARADLISSSKKKSKSKRGEKAQILVLAVAPTRELALQTHDTFTELGKPFGLTSVALYGGVDKEPQRRALLEESAAMVVGTPGRILDLINEGSCNLSGVTYLVLDEADRMLDRGFENDIRTIIGHAAPSEQRQTLMFSATWPDAVRRLASTFQRNPVRVTVGSDDLTANRRVEQVIEVFDDQREKDSRLSSHLRRLKARKGDQQSGDEARILVFVLYKKEAARVEQNLKWQGFSVGGIHGDLSQVARISALDDFKTGKTQLLVATDVAARGLDIPNVGTVINYSFPLTVEDYIHRIGRTGRGGRSGKSVTFFTGDNHERALAGELAKVIRESGFDADPLKKFPMTIKKKEHSVYGAFYRDDIPLDAKPTRMKF